MLNYGVDEVPGSTNEGRSIMNGVIDGDFIEKKENIFTENNTDVRNGTIVSQICKQHNLIDTDEAGDVPETPRRPAKQKHQRSSVVFPWLVRTPKPLVKKEEDTVGAQIKLPTAELKKTCMEAESKDVSNKENGGGGGNVVVCV